MIKHVEVKTYDYCGINVTVHINYDDEQISLVQKSFGESHLPFKKKEYVFIERGLEYMNGWITILEAMQYAIKEAAKELETYLVQKAKEKTDEITDVLTEASNLVKARSMARESKGKQKPR